MKTLVTLIAISIAAPAIAQAAAPAADPARKAYMDSAFARMDANRDGKIDRAEFDRFMAARIAQQKAQFETAFKTIDANHNGRIEKSEAAAHPSLASQFARIDTNKDGAVTPAEIRAAILAAQQQDLPQG